jgi:hypothetical protein
VAIQSSARTEKTLEKVPCDEHDLYFDDRIANDQTNRSKIISHWLTGDSVDSTFITLAVHSIFFCICLARLVQVSLCAHSANGGS